KNRRLWTLNTSTGCWKNTGSAKQHWKKKSNCAATFSKATRPRLYAISLRCFSTYRKAVKRKSSIPPSQKRCSESWQPETKQRNVGFTTPCELPPAFLCSYWPCG